MEWLEIIGVLKWIVDFVTDDDGDVEGGKVAILIILFILILAIVVLGVWGYNTYIKPSEPVQIVSQTPDGEIINWPVLSDKSYCEFTSDRTSINVYIDKECKSRGTCEPAPAVANNAYIGEGDVCKILSISMEDQCAFIEYPTVSRGYRRGYVGLTDLFGVSSPKELVVSEGRVKAFKGSGKIPNGYIEKGVNVYSCGNSGAYTAVIYSLKSWWGKKKYVYGYVTTDDYNNIVKVQSDDSKRDSTIVSQTVTENNQPEENIFDIVEGKLYMVKGTPGAQGVVMRSESTSAAVKLGILGEGEIVRACGNYSLSQSLYGYVYIYHINSARYAYVMARYLQPYEKS